MFLTLCNTRGYLPNQWGRLCFCVGTSIERLRSQALVQAAAEGVSRVSANDIMCAILWLVRYVLQNPLHQLQGDITVRPVRPASHPSCGARCLILLYDDIECAQRLEHPILC